MNTQTKVWLFIGVILVVLGLITFAGVMTIYNWDFTKLSTVKYETNTYEISDEFDSISLSTDTADINFERSADGICKAVFYEYENARHIAEVKDGTLIINILDERKWYEYIGITIGTPKITVYLPENEYDALTVKESTGDIEIPKDFKFRNIDISVSTGDVKNFACALESIKIKASTGDITVQNISAHTLELSVSTGKVTAKSINCKGDIKVKVSTGDTKLSDISCGNIITSGSTGDISLKNVIATERFSIERNTGDVMFDRCDADEIFVKTSTGSVKGNLLTSKVFITNSDTGSVSVPETVTGGKCEITTDTGDIKMSIDQ